MHQHTIKKQQHEVNYEYRIGCALVMFCTFNDSRLTHMADLLEKSSEIEEVTSVTRYEGTLSSLVIKMKKGYTASKCDEDIAAAIELIL